MGSTTLQLATQFTSWPIDWVIFVACTAIFTLESFKSGSSRTRALSIALPLSVLLSQLFPHTIGFSLVAQYFTTPLAQNIEFLAVMVVFFILLYRLFFGYGFGSGSMISALMNGFAATIILYVVWLQIPSLDSVWHLSDQVRALFGESYRLLWLVLAFVLMAIAAS